MSSILITGGTGFIGRALTRQLTEAGHHVRVLIRPSQKSPNIPRGTGVEAVVSSLNDRRGLRAAITDIDVVYHLASAEWRGAYESLHKIDIQGTEAVAEVCAEARIDRLFYVSHLGADRASGFAVMKAKAIAEEHIRRSGVDYTILRTGIVFGPQDGFTTGLAFILKASPFLFFLPNNGDSLLQPLWIEDLTACLAWSLDEENTRNQLYEIGGPEFLSFRHSADILMETLQIRRAPVPISAAYLRGLTVLIESNFPGFPASIYWLDYLSANHTTALDTLPRSFHLMPARFSPNNLDYLTKVDWRKLIWRSIFSGPRRGKRRSSSAGSNPSKSVS